MDTDRLDPDLTEALARGREPRKLWPVLHAPRCMDRRWFRLHT